MKSRPVSVNVTANGLAANQAQQTANQAQASAIKYKTAWEEANAENLAALSTAQSEFKSNLAWVKSQIHEGKHQNDSAVASLQSDMESSWGSMSTVEQSLYNSASTATSEVDSHLESLRAQNSQSLADLHNTANSLHAAATSLHADANAMRSSLTAATSELGKDITTTRSSLDGVRNSLRTASSELGDNLAGARNSLAAVDSSLRTATSEVGNNLNSVKNSLAAVDADLRNGIKQANNDLSAAKTSLTATGNSLANRAGSLATATSELQRQTGQLSGSLSTADSMIMFNSNAIAEVKRTAGEISTTVSNIRVGGRNLLRNSAKLPYSGNFNDNSWPTGQWRIAGCTNDTDDMKRTSKEITDPPQGNKATALSYTGVLRSSVNDISLVAINSVPISGNVTVSFWARQTSGVDKAFVSAGWGGRGMLNTNASTEKWGTTQYRKLFLPKDGSWTRFWATFNVNSKENVYIGAGNTGTSAEVQICLVKIETGTMVTDWTPAPEDTDQAISKVSQTADAIKADLANTKGDVASVKATASSLQTQITNNKNNISTVKQTADSLTSTVGQMPAKWQQAINDKASAQVLTSGVDMNNLTTAGTYLVTDFSAKNTPIGAYFMAVVESTADKSRILQRVKKDDSSVAYERSNYNRGWTAWERTATGTDITQVKQTIDGITTRVSNTEGNVSGLQQTAKSIQTSVSDNAKNISNVQQTATALQSSLSNAQGEISNVKQTASKLQSDLSNAEGDISSLQQTASGLTSRVGSAEGNISQLQQTANGLTSTVSNLHAGDRNYVRGTSSDWANLTDFNNKTNYCLQIGTFYINDLQVGDKVGFGITFKNTGITSGTMIVQGYGDVSGWSFIVGINDSVTNIVKTGTTTTLWKLHTMKAVDVENSKISLQVRTDNVPAGGTLGVKCVYIKKGTMATDWTPAPEDTDQAISKVSQTADAIKADLTNTKGDVASVKLKADSLTTQLADAKGNISRLQQTATGLQSTVQSQSGKISQLQQDTKGLTATVADGGQNLILNSGNPSTLDHWRWKGEVTLQKHPFWKNGTENLFVLWNTSSTDEKFFSNERFAIEPNQDYTLSFYAFNNSALKNADVWYLPRKSSSSNDYDTAINLASVVKFSTDNAQYIRLTFNSGDYDEGYIRFDNNSSTTEGTWAGLYLADIQLEKGKIATAWSNSPGDIAQLKLTADGLTSKVADTQGNVSKLQLTASSLQTQITNNKNDVASVKVKADGIRTDLTNAKNDIASVKSKADSLTSSMTNANNQISTLQQRADSLTSTLGNGGVNLLNGTSDAEITNTYPTSGYTDKVYYAMSVPANQTDYVLSFDAKSTVAGDKIVCFMYSPNQVTKAVSSQNVTNTNADGNIPFTLTTDWVRYWVHYTITPTDKKPTIIVGRTHANMGSGTISYKCVQLEYGDTATPWKPSNGDISSLRQTASSLTSDMKDAKGNISSLQQTAGGLTSDVRDAKGNISSLQQKATELDGQIKAVDGRATTIKATADGISARVSKIEGNQTVGSLLKLTGNEAGLGSYVNGKLIAGINTNTNGNVTIDGKQIHLTHYTQIDDGCINASKITVHNSVGNDNGEAKDQYLAAAWGQLNSTIGKTTDNGKTSLWGSINQTAEKFSSYYTRADVDNKLSQQSSLISQTANNITALVNDAKNFTTFTVSSTNKWDFNNTKSAYGNWFLNGDTSSNYVYNGPSYTWGQKLAPYMYVTSRGPKDGSRFVVTVWKDNDPTQYQRVWNGSWSDWVMLPNSQNLISAINLSPDSVKISGKNIELNGNTKVTGRLDLMQDSARSVSQSTNYHNNWVWNNAHIYFDNYLQLLGENCNVHYTNTNTTLNGGKTFYSITTLTPGYLKFTTYNHKVNDTDENFDGQITRSYLDSGRLETPEVYTDKFVITGHHIRVRDNQFLMLTNKKGTNFDNNGSVGFQVWGGIVLGQNTIGAPSNELYFQRGNIDAILGQSYSDAPKLTLHAQKVVSQEANSVSSRLSVKTSITKVTYDRALMAVQNTDMYDYRYIADNSGQHYVSGIIDDVHDKPEYNMDPMLINQERTARIDANLLGYHHVVLQEILKRLDKLEAK